MWEKNIVHTFWGKNFNMGVGLIRFIVSSKLDLAWVIADNTVEVELRTPAGYQKTILTIEGYETIYPSFWSGDANWLVIRACAREMRPCVDNSILWNVDTETYINLETATGLDVYDAFAWGNGLFYLNVWEEDSRNIYTFDPVTNQTKLHLSNARGLDVTEDGRLIVYATEATEQDTLIMVLDQKTNEDFIIFNNSQADIPLDLTLDIPQIEWNQ